MIWRLYLILWNGKHGHFSQSGSFSFEHHYMSVLLPFNTEIETSLYKLSKSLLHSKYLNIKVSYKSVCKSFFSFKFDDRFFDFPSILITKLFPRG